MRLLLDILDCFWKKSSSFFLSLNTFHFVCLYLLFFFEVLYHRLLLSLRPKSEASPGRGDFINFISVYKQEELMLNSVISQSISAYFNCDLVSKS